MKAKKFALKVIRMRKYLIKNQLSQRNPALSMQRIQRLELLIEAYGSIWNENGWKKFIQRNLADFLFLIPANNSKQKLEKELESILYGN